MRMVEWSLQALQYGALGPSDRRMFVSRLLEGITAMSSVRCTESKNLVKRTALHILNQEADSFCVLAGPCWVIMTMICVQLLR